MLLSRARRTPVAMSAAAADANGTARRRASAAAKATPRRPAIVAFDLDATLWTPEMYQLWGGAPFRRCPKTGRVEDRNGERLELMHHAPAVLSMLAAARACGGGGEDEAEDDDADDGDEEDGDEEQQPDDARALLLSDRGWESTEVAYVSRTEHADWAEDALRAFSLPLAEAAVGEGGLPSSSSPSSPRARRKADRRAARHHRRGGTALPPHLHALASHREIYPGSKVAHFARIRERSGAAYGDMLFFDNEAWNVREVERLGVVCVYCPRGLTRAAWEEGVLKFAEATGAVVGAGAGASKGAPLGARRK